MRLTNDIRRNIQDKIMSDVPTIDYAHKLMELTQEIILQHMDPKVRAVYDDENLRPLLQSASVQFRLDSSYNRIVKTHYVNHQGHKIYFNHPGLKDPLDVNLEPRYVEHVKKGTLYYDLTHAALKSGFVHKHFEQRALLDSVKERIKATLASVTTTQKLFDVLEPEFHHLIPRDDDKKIQLPATAAPFADDLRKLGANLPEVPKAKKRA